MTSTSVKASAHKILSNSHQHDKRYNAPGGLWLIKSFLDYQNASSYT